ncbi:MAG: hypothetical protein ABI577_17655 [bacterium]
MRLLILGTSSTSGQGLPDTSKAWPWLAEAELPAMLGEPVELEHIRLFPIGPKAVPMAKAAIERANADVIVFSFGAYPCAVATVSAKLGKRFGPKAQRWFRTAETKFDERTGSTTLKPRRMNNWVRAFGRKVIGIAPLASFEEVTGIQKEIVQALSQLEHTVVAVYCEPFITRGASWGSPGANDVLERDRELISGLARRHHFLIADCRPEYFAAPNIDDLFLKDALHKSEAGHRLQADAFYRCLAAADSPYAKTMARALQSATSESAAG